MPSWYKVCFFGILVLWSFPLRVLIASLSFSLECCSILIFKELDGFSWIKHMMELMSSKNWKITKREGLCPMSSSTCGYYIDTWEALCPPPGVSPALGAATSPYPALARLQGLVVSCSVLMIFAQSRLVPG